MSRPSFSLLPIAIMLAIPSPAVSQTVSMSGGYGESNGRELNLPLNPPKLPCTNLQNARCHQGSDVTAGIIDNLAAPGSGVPVAGAGVVIMPGGLSPGDPFTIPAGVFAQDRGNQFTPVTNHPAVVQLDTSRTFYGPADSRAVNPSTQTRMFQANAWNVPGNAQAGRIAATTTPVDAAIQTTHAATIRYKAGPNAFGGTMAILSSGGGGFYYLPFQGTGSAPSTTIIGRIPYAEGINGDPVTRNGAGWNHTARLERGPGIIRSNSGLGPLCTSATPPSPAGCGGVTNFTGPIFNTLESVRATSTLHQFAWTTGTVEVELAGATTNGFPLHNDLLLTGMGYDEISTTPSGGTIRNIGLVAGAFTRRTQPPFGVFYSHQIAGLNMRFAPEPASTASLLVGLGLLTVLAGRRR